jgi:Rad3-related DNA helicase
MVTVLDSRILNKRYGKLFIQSIPECPMEVLSAREAATELEEIT